MKYVSRLNDLDLKKKYFVYRFDVKLNIFRALWVTIAYSSYFHIQNHIRRFELDPWPKSMPLSSWVCFVIPFE